MRLDGGLGLTVGILRSMTIVESRGNSGVWEALSATFVFAPGDRQYASKCAGYADIFDIVPTKKRYCGRHQRCRGCLYVSLDTTSALFRRALSA